MRPVAGIEPGVTVATAQRLMAEFFRGNGIDEAQADARVLIAHALQVDRAKLVADSARIMEAIEIDAVFRLVERRLAREPVARILGCKEFWSLSLAVTPDVLVPRPETETVVETALDIVIRNGLRLEKLRLLDIGTGSGALLLALLNELPNAVGTATDISVGALVCARANAERHGLAARCQFIATNIAAGLHGAFDLIVSNPPYIAQREIARLAPEVRDYDPAIALDGGKDGLDAYRAIAAVARDLLAADARLVVEMGAGQEPAVRELFTKAGLTVLRVRNDLSGTPRAVAARLS